MMRRTKLSTLIILSLAIVQSLFGGKLGGLNGWLSDFEEAKALAAKEGKYILICSDFAEGGRWVEDGWGCFPGYHHFFKSPEGQFVKRAMHGGEHFIRKAKRRFVLLRINLARGLHQVSSPSDYRLNHPLIANDDSKWWGYGDIRVVDAAGKLVKRLVSLDEALADAFETKSKRNKKTRKKAKDDVPQSQVMDLPGTCHTTPAGWMDNFRAAQEIAVREKKSLFVVFTLDFCTPCSSYRDEILTSPTIVNELRKDYILVYLLMGGYGGSMFTMMYEENRQILKELMGDRNTAYPVTVMMEGDGTQKSVVLGPWEKFAGHNWKKRLKDSYTERKLAEKFLDFIKEERKRIVK